MDVKWNTEIYNSKHNIQLNIDPYNMCHDLFDIRCKLRNLLPHFTMPFGITRWELHNMFWNFHWNRLEQKKNKPTFIQTKSTQYCELSNRIFFCNHPFSMVMSVSVIRSNIGVCEFRTSINLKEIIPCISIFINT